MILNNSNISEYLLAAMKCSLNLPENQLFQKKKKSELLDSFMKYIVHLVTKTLRNHDACFDVCE